MNEDPRLARLTAICLALPEATKELTGKHATFRIRGKTFAYFLDDHHGDGIVGLNCRAPWGEPGALVAGDPERFYLPAYLASRGWIGLRLDVGEVDWEEVADLVTDSYLRVAPKRLGAQVK
jgi:predicted DNA-binding protein (MmcQ/YjbR family)